MTNIVILGGSYAGVSIAHRVLKKTPKNVPIKITMVSPNTDLYWNMATPRAAAGVYGDEKIFKPIEPGFKQYGDRFQFIVGTAESLDESTKTVRLADGNKLKYDILVLATGSRTKAPTVFKGVGSTQDVKAELQRFRDDVKQAHTIVIAGGGPTGIELAGEVAFEFGSKKDVHLLAKGSALSTESPLSVQRQALDGLTNLRVHVKLNTSIASQSTLTDGRTELRLSDGSTLTADLYVPTFGVVPNSSYVPSEYLSSKGFVVVDPYLRVKGTKDIWAAGDVADIEWKQFKSAADLAAHVAKNLTNVLQKVEPVPYKATQPSGRILGFSMGRKTGAGSFGSWKMPQFLIGMARKELFTQNLGPMVSGTMF